MDRRRLLISHSITAEDYKKMCLFYGVSTNSVNIDVSAASKCVNIKNEDGTFSYYVIDTSKYWSGSFSLTSGDLLSITFEETAVVHTLPTAAKKWFSNRRNLKAIEGFSRVNFSGVDSFDSFLNNCWNLQNTDINLTGAVTSKCADLYSAFSNLGYKSKFDVTSLCDFTTWDVQNVTDFRSLFYNAYAKTELNISGWDMRSAKYIDDAFRINCPIINMAGIKFVPAKIDGYSDDVKYRIFHNGLSLLKLTNVDNSDGLIEFMEREVINATTSALILLDDGINSYDSTKSQGWVPDYRIAGITLKSGSTVPDICVSRPASDGTILASIIHADSSDYSITADDITAIKAIGDTATAFTFDARCVFPDEASTNAASFFSGLFNTWTSLKTVRLTGVDNAVVLALKSSNFGNTSADILKNIEVISDNGTFIYSNNLWTLKIS